MKKGDRVLVTYGGRTVHATILIASSNGRSLAIGWDDGMLDGHCGMMPILRDEDGVYRSLIEDRPITLTPIEGAL